MIFYVNESYIIGAVASAEDKRVRAGTGAPAFHGDSRVAGRGQRSSCPMVLVMGSQDAEGIPYPSVVPHMASLKVQEVTSRGTHRPSAPHVPDVQS